MHSKGTSAKQFPQSSSFFWSHILVSKKTARILHVEELICESHSQEKLHDEEIAVTKIKMNPNYFFRYAKKT